MCEDRHSESTAGDCVASTRADPPSARPPSPDAVASDPNVAAGRHIPRSPLASHSESLMDMQIPPASPSPRSSRKRGLDELIVDGTPPSPDKLQRELDRQHEEALEARRAATSLLQPEASSRTQAQESKRQRKLAYRGKPLVHDAKPRTDNNNNNNNKDNNGKGGGGYTREGRPSSPANSSEH
ncbi:uncharacterized protein ColSpa_07653 [Colletotrichum spaethianum]|uniref:Uncharacterized protein n=1 Tax=Colletotrichum spaethianum TaxID=700344 RepID=A0AA37P893_9PEZI|nr:uncharacterized protein ColSpa_07653 [Colletotrichum spaethianum]GKT47472.1 hypothetical protein ColSpa_07653 [Colletotrichum spaethianum]